MEPANDVSGEARQQIPPGSADVGSDLHEARLHFGLQCRARATLEQSRRIVQIEKPAGGLPLPPAQHDVDVGAVGEKNMDDAAERWS